MMKTKVTILIFLALLAVSATGQDFETMQSAFSKSYTLEYEKDYNGAIKELLDIYQEDSYLINVRLGWLYYLAGDYPTSSGYYEMAIQLKPYSVEAKFGATYPLSAMGNWSEVKKQYISILEIDEMNTKANYHIGLMYYNAEDFATAMKHFEKVVNQYPFDYDSTRMLAWTSFKLGKLREAEVLFKKTLLIRPGDESAEEGLELLK